MTDDLYYSKLESTPTIDLVDMIREKDEQIAELEKSCDETQELLDKQTEATYKLDKENAELKILVSSMLYEINDLWDISEMNEDVRKHAEKIDSEVEK